MATLRSTRSPEDLFQGNTQIGDEVYILFTVDEILVRELSQVQELAVVNTLGEVMERDDNSFVVKVAIEETIVGAALDLTSVVFSMAQILRPEAVDAGEAVHLISAEVA